MQEGLISGASKLSMNSLGYWGSGRLSREPPRRDSDAPLYAEQLEHREVVIRS